MGSDEAARWAVRLYDMAWLASSSEVGDTDGWCDGQKKSWAVGSSNSGAGGDAAAAVAAGYDDRSSGVPIP